MPDGATGAVAIGPEGDAVLFRTPRVEKVPHGVGDAFSALVAAGLPIGAALGHLRALVQASAGADRLAAVESADRWIAAPAIKPSALPGSTEN